MKIKITSYDLFNDRFSCVIKHEMGEVLDTIPACLLVKLAEESEQRTFDQPESFIGYEFEI